MMFIKTSKNTEKSMNLFMVKGEYLSG
jgi:hypothetical protein